jgi:hypothetical protein
LSEPVASDSAAGDSSREGVRKVYHEPSEPVDLLSVAGAPLARRMLPPAIAAVLVLVLVALLARRVLAD